MAIAATKTAAQETPAELRALAAAYRGLAEIGAADYRAGRLRLAAYLERLAEEREHPRGESQRQA